jgi:protein-tyrosine phosphatase
MQQPKKIDVFMQMGCLLQITADSITGLFGSQSQKCGLHFIEKSMVTIIATDAHNLHKRKPSMQEAQQFLLSIVEEAYVTQMTSSNPAQMLS